jgi:hypothetical protein
VANVQDSEKLALLVETPLAKRRRRRRRKRRMRRRMTSPTTR